MNKPKFIFKLFLLLLIAGTINVFAQTEVKQQQAMPTYEVVLQILTASNNSNDKSTLPASLSGVVKKLKTNYNFSDYRLTETFLQRTSDSAEYKSLLSGFAQTDDRTAPVFSEWWLRNLRNLPSAGGQNVLQFDNFHFGARVPVVSSYVNEAGKNSSNVNYESVGINMTRLSLKENEPTVVGSLATPKSGELMFLVLTIKPAE